jgi:N-methylhydantoinase A
VLLRVRELPTKKLENIYGELREEIAAELKGEHWTGRAAYEPGADLRYRGQGYELALAYGRDMLERFHAEHKRRYGYSSPDREVEIVTVRVRGRIPSPEKLDQIAVASSPAKLTKEKARVWFEGKPSKATIMPRSMLKTGKRYRGPAIITEYSATTVVPPGLFFQADKAGNLLVEVV